MTILAFVLHHVDLKAQSRHVPRLATRLIMWFTISGYQLFRRQFGAVLMCVGWCCTVYPKKYTHGFVVLCFVVVMQSFIMNSHEVFIHIHQGCFAGTGAIGRLPQCQWSKPDGYGEISQCITTTKHSTAKTVCIFLGIYCSCHNRDNYWVIAILIWNSNLVKSHNMDSMA